MSFAEILILGAGAIGSAYGAFLSSNNAVTLIGRQPHMNAIKEKGLTILGETTQTYTLATATEITNISADTLLIVSVKAHDLHEALSKIQPLIKVDTVLLILQNGLGVEEIAQKALKGKGIVVRGIVTIGSEILEPGCIRVRKNPTFLNSDEFSKRIAKLFKVSGLDAIVSDSFQTEIWRKATINCVLNPLSAILQAQTHELLSPHLDETRKNIIEECIAVGAAEGVELEPGSFDVMYQALPRYTNRTSMYQDIQRGRKTEIDFLNGKIVELGKIHAIATPVNACLTQLIHYLENKKNECG
ncbi:MAG: ketopantoate reductase family protein [Candidatus Thorarchaeota archaeon]